MTFWRSLIQLFWRSNLDLVKIFKKYLISKIYRIFNLFVFKRENHVVISDKLIYKEKLKLKIKTQCIHWYLTVPFLHFCCYYNFFKSFFHFLSKSAFDIVQGKGPLSVSQNERIIPYWNKKRFSLLKGKRNCPVPK